MSIDFAPLKKVQACDLFDGRLEAFGVLEIIVPDRTTERKRCLTDRRNYLWVYIDSDGIVACFSNYGFNDSTEILVAIAEACDTDLVSEHEPQYWGFDTQEEWDAWMEQMSREYIAKKLAENDPALLLPTNKGKLLKEIETGYYREHAAKITLTPEQLFADVTDEDDLSSA